MSKMQADFSILIEPRPGNPYYSVRIFMVLVVTQFMLDKQKNQNTHCHPYSQTKNIDENIERILLGISENDFEVVADHG